MKKTEKMVTDFRRMEPAHHLIRILGEEVNVVDTYKYLGVHLDSRLDWMSRLYFPRKLQSFYVGNKMSEMFYHSVVASGVMYAAVCKVAASTPEIPA